MPAPPRAVAALAVLVCLLPMSGAQGDGPTAYAPPFAVGPSGGDRWSTHSADPDGQVLIGRAYVVPALIGCGAGAPFANLRVTHPATGPVSEVEVDYVDAAVEPYSFVSVGVHGGDGQWFTSRKVRGLLTGSGTVTVPVPWPSTETRFPRPVVVDLGLEASGACPSVSGGTITFTAVRVR